MTPVEQSFLVKQRARELGFDSAGITDLAPTPHASHLHEWLRSGMAGSMTYLHRQAARRANPAEIVPGATRALVLSRNYYRPDPPPSDRGGLVAKYARGADYHDVLAGPLEALATFIRELGPPGTVARSFVDAGPVPERELAQRAGLGWIGKNTMLIDPARGSFFFLASVLTSLDLAVDPPFEADRCGTCRRCLDACPTGALPGERILDARRCISYLTIEHRGEIPPDLAPLMGTRVFGCDICQDVCPWNVSFASDATATEWNPEMTLLDLDELEGMTEEEFERRYGRTPLERPGYEGMRRNAGVARANQISGEGLAAHRS
jgi:epoxyqueuosine reductase